MLGQEAPQCDRNTGISTYLQAKTGNKVIKQQPNGFTRQQPTWTQSKLKVNSFERLLAPSLDGKLPCWQAPSTLNPQIRSTASKISNVCADFRFLTKSAKQGDANTGIGRDLKLINFASQHVAESAAYSALLVESVSMSTMLPMAPNPNPCGCQTQSQSNAMPCMWESHISVDLPSVCSTGTGMYRVRVHVYHTDRYFHWIFNECIAMYDVSQYLLRVATE